MKGIDSLGALAGRRVLLRADLNVPLHNGEITDDGRIRASLPTIRRLSDAGARVVVCSHLGRPKGAPDPKYSLRPVGERLADLAGMKVSVAEDVGGPSSGALADQAGPGELVLLENLRFEPGETSKDDGERGEFATRLAALADAYVDDAFGAVHRKHASVYDVARLLPHAAGDLVLREVNLLSRLTGQPDRPYVVVLGGSKVSDKLGVIQSLLPKVDRLLVGGGMCFTFLKARGGSIGASLLEAEMVDTCKRLLDEAAGRIVLPVDVVVAKEVSETAATETVEAAQIPEDMKGLDIGPRSIELFRGDLAGARTVFWNGPMGVFEVQPFATGTLEVAKAIAALADATTVVGGGDSAAAVRQLGLPEQAYTHISTGGGASLEYLEGKSLPGLTALED